MKFFTLEVPTTIYILCTRPFRLLFAHPDNQETDLERWPIDPLPMGVPIAIRDTGITDLAITPKIFPAQLRMWAQANVHVKNVNPLDEVKE